MVLPIATAQHSGPLDTPGEQAYLWARSGIARSATTRSNYVSLLTSIDWIVRDNTGNIISTTDISEAILLNTLNVTQVLNDEPDTCSFTLKPQEPPAVVPLTGQEIRVTWASGGSAGVTLFHGYIVTSQSDWRLLNAQPPWVAIQCQDPMWRFDARIVTYRFPAQSVSDSIAYLVKYFCNVDPATPSPLDFSTAFVVGGMPSIPAFDVVNQRPSTVMRTLTASVGGGFYIEGLTVHAWANSVSEPGQTNPTPLTVGLPTLHAFRRTEDATQVRRRVLVEGRRSETLIPMPAVATTLDLGVGLSDASLFDLGTSGNQLARCGAQWVDIQRASSPTSAGKNPPQAKLHLAFTPGQITLSLKAVPAGTVIPTHGWIRVGNQYSRYGGFTGDPIVDGWVLALPDQSLPYSVFTVAIPVGETVEWVDGVMAILSHGLQFDIAKKTGDPFMRAHPVSTPVVTLAMAETTRDRWPPLEGFVQDGRYSYAGAQARAAADLTAFKDPLVSVEWETDDLNALPGRSQVIALSSEAVTPAINTTVTILRVEMSFPLRTLPPRRQCTGGVVKPSSFMDLVVTTQN